MFLCLFLGEYKVTMKGCFTDTSCNNTECIDISGPKKTNFCCCIGNRCNSEFRLVTTTSTKAPEKEEFTTESREMSMPIIALICVAAAFVVSVMFGGVYFYKSKKASMFNEIPTVIEIKFPLLFFNFHVNNKM